jgi:hypothetical protein
MGNKRSIAEPRQSSKAPDQVSIGIAEPKVVLDACLPALRRQFDQRTLGFKPLTRAERVTCYMLSGVNQQFGTAREVYAVHPLCQNVDAIYWAGITVNFQFINSSHHLVDAGIVVFEGNGFGVKVPLLRAEWHCSDEHMRARHAQPHWHAYYRPEPRASAVFTPESPINFASAPEAAVNETAEAQAMQFHFAMSAAWQRGDTNGHVTSIESGKALEDWLCGCLSYIAGQRR